MTLSKNNLIVFFLITILSLGENSLAQKDSTMQILSFKNYLEIVRNQHPISKQAALQIEKGDAQVLSARGNFDPKLYADIAQKYFKGDQYYHLMDGGLQIPTWFGIEFYAGYENSRGEYLNPQNYDPAAGLAYAGISVPLGQDLLMDKRRAQLRKAQIYLNMTAEERRLIMNDLIMEAAEAYWIWFESYNVLKVYEEAFSLSNQRFVASKQSALLGDIAYIDTLEAGIQVQTRNVSLQQAKLDFQNSKALLSIYLWQEGTIPLELGENVTPPQEISFTLEDTPYIAPPIDRSASLVDHPELKYAQLKIDQLNIERRLALERVKPQINLKYNALNEPLGNNPFAQYSMKNYTWGADFQMPLLLRNGRGELKLAQLNIQDATLGLDSKQALLKMKSDQANNEWSATNQQVEIYTKTVTDLERLFNAETTKFFTGESSVFMVNTRESNYINSKIKLIELQAKNQKSLIKTYHSLGMLK
jgi:outer membrane protein TolC